MTESQPGGAAGKLWGGRFSRPTDALVDELNASIGFDRRLFRQDIMGSIAHVRMLARQGIIPSDDAARIEQGLRQIYDEIRRGEHEFRLADEDIHLSVERRLREIIGPAAGRLHTARSRNDQVALDFRLWTREALIRIAAGLTDTIGALLEIAERHPDAIMPGYTHVQRAQPVLLAHHMLAYVEMLFRDLDRLRDAYRRVNLSPLGAGALAGVTYPIDRQFVADLLGFDGVCANSLDAVSDRDFVVDLLSACAQIMLHLSRLAEEIILWSSSEFGFIELDDAFATGSSIMPQKKNPDVAELIRGKTGRVYGHLMGMLTVGKGLPLAYNKDLQEDKEGAFDTVDTVLLILRVLPPMLRTTRFRTDRMLAAAGEGFTLATDVADHLVRQGLPFREAHEIVGRVVAYCVEQGKDLPDLTPEEWGRFSPLLVESPPPLTPADAIAAREMLGGTGARHVADARIAAAAARDEWVRWVDGRAEALAAVSRRLGLEDTDDGPEGGAGDRASR
ncbi:argininosuccinate lyase [Sphaerobacter sp.]|uniref:argininosuccinate lyase n=1 Tax=Sphaerobacter sp. TaxID=2099654 RepID=UPI001D84DF30|nr:argininosuccinate lyase [Sphaerobacter sp.]MBX5445238.1 argininosuccinate lyase [Sphaerobacter sp.]